ncbi:hypothetical protein PGT21_028529 [Puccinia graminis f. sp. tritici]|uniref:Uncharacterized protein n=1 Tax=Puccinia graminis f. sp. tritici TaxID=56615 RepID=A0A5B0R592_PUCGR|nr:hypothetical protein PGT21_028529 [Puccinia graminis f. sp. tritici]KAA1120766.1 hypothetical protein PGTUg99_013309 [Puccinia graminis f. sp. tritici]
MLLPPSHPSKAQVSPLEQTFINQTSNTLRLSRLSPPSFIDPSLLQRTRRLSIDQQSYHRAL